VIKHKHHDIIEEDGLLRYRKEWQAEQYETKEKIKLEVFPHAYH